MKIDQVEFQEALDDSKHRYGEQEQALARFFLQNAIISEPGRSYIGERLRWVAHANCSIVLGYAPTPFAPSSIEHDVDAAASWFSTVADWDVDTLDMAIDHCALCTIARVRDLNAQGRTVLAITYQTAIEQEEIGGPITYRWDILVHHCERKKT